MGLSTKGPITRWQGSWAQQEQDRRKRLIGFAYHELDDQRIADAITVAEIRESLNAGNFRRISL